MTSGSGSADSEEVGSTAGREDPELGRRQERKEEVLGRGKVGGLRGMGQGRGQGRGAWRGGRGGGGAWGSGDGRGEERVAWGGVRGNWGKGLVQAHKGEAQIPRKTIHVKQTLI